MNLQHLTSSIVFIYLYVTLFLITYKTNNLTDNMHKNNNLINYN